MKSVSTYSIPADRVGEFRRDFSDVLAESYEDVCVHGAVYVDDEGFVTVNNHPSKNNYYTTSVVEWLSERM